MLVLRRKVEESIVLFRFSKKIKISILAVEGKRVKIGISAPPDVSIVREEHLDNNAKWNQDEQKASA
jgi:carbon storage regulator